MVYIIAKDGDRWVAHYDTDSNKEFFFTGKTPEEALESILKYEDFYRRV